LLCGESQVRRPGPLPGIGDNSTGPGQDPVDRGPGQHRGVVVLQVPADGVRAGVQALLGQLFAQRQHQLDRRWWGGAR
jgi:hypothetical protein